MLFIAIEVLLILLFVSIVVLGHEFGHFLFAKLAGIKVNEFGFGYKPRIWAKKIGETEYSLNALPFGGFVAIEEGKTGESGRGFNNQPFGKRLMVMLGGILFNFLIGWVAFSLLFLVGIPQAIYITDILPDSPAMAAGLKSGDRLIGFNNNIDTFLTFIKSRPGQPVALEIEREGEMIKVSITPEVLPPSTNGRIGAEITEAGIPKTGFLNSFKQGLETCFKVIGLIFNRIISLLRLGGEAGKISGVVGVVNAIHTANKLGIAYVLELLGMVSLNFTVVNILPIPALDGGRIFFLLLEKIKRKPIPQHFEATVHLVGYLILLFLMIIVNIRDISRIFLK